MKVENCEVYGVKYSAQDAQCTGIGCTACTGCAGEHDEDLCNALPDCISADVDDVNSWIYVEDKQ